MEANQNMIVHNFLFHRVNPKRDLLWDPMDVALFDKCIRYITRKFEVHLFEDLNDLKSRSSKKKLATIMFDDGYKDNLEFAIPILEKYNCKASFYVVTDCIDNNIPTWTHVLEHLFQETNKTNLELDFDFLPQEFQKVLFSTLEERLSFAKKFKPFLKTIEHSQRIKILEKITNTFYDVTLPKLMMDWEDLVAVKKLGHYIGSHTVTHCMLGTMTDENEILEELISSGKRIEEKLGYFPKTISYPVGSFNKETKKLAQKAGYQYGLAVGQNIYKAAEQDLFEVKRIELYNEAWWKTRLRITNTLENIKTLIKYR